MSEPSGSQGSFTETWYPPLSGPKDIKVKIIGTDYLPSTEEAEIYTGYGFLYVFSPYDEQNNRCVSLYVNPTSTEGEERLKISDRNAVGKTGTCNWRAADVDTADSQTDGTFPTKFLKFLVSERKQMLTGC